MAHYRMERSNRASRSAMAVFGVLVIILFTAPFWVGRPGLHLLIQFFTYLALAQMWSLLAGFGGLVSIGQQAFVGLGGYGLFAITVFGGVHPFLSLFLAGLGAALIAIPTGLVAFRLQGAYFAVGTWVIAEVFRLSFSQISSLGGGSGMSLSAAIITGMAKSRERRDDLIYWLGLGVALASILLVFGLLRSRWGLAMTAIRDSEAASDSLGVETYRTKFIIYVVAGGVTGLAGALIFLEKLRISPDAAFSLKDWTALVIFMVIIGGIGTLEGPILGVIFYFLLRELAADWGSWYLILLGAIAVAMMLVSPQGLWGLIAQKRKLQLFPVGRRLIAEKAGVKQ